MLTSPSVLLNDEDFCTGSWRELSVVIWRHDTTRKGIDACRQGLQDLQASHPNGCAVLSIIEPNASMPPGEVRDELSRTLREFGDLIKASGVVFEGAGFRAAAVRSVVTGISLVAKQPFPHKVFATVNAASSWMAPSMPDGATSPRELAEAVADIRRQLAEMGGGRSATI